MSSMPLPTSGCPQVSGYLCFAMILKVSCAKIHPGHCLHPPNVLPPNSHSRPTPEVGLASSSQHHLRLPSLLQSPFSPHGESTSRTTRDTAGLVSSLQKHDINTDTGHSTRQPRQNLLMSYYKTSKQTGKPAAEQHTATVSPSTHDNYTYIGLLSFTSGNKSNKKKSY